MHWSSPLSLRAYLAVSFLVFFLPVTAAGQVVSVEGGTTLRVQNGATWNLEGGTMDFGTAGSSAQLDEQSGGRVRGGELTAIRSLNRPSSVDPAGLGLQLTASADLGDVTITRGHEVQVAQNDNESIKRYYDVDPSQNNSGLGAELTFTYHDAELNGRTESELEFFKSEDGGNSWSEEGQDNQDAAGNTVTLGGIASFSRWTLGGESNPLPVELANFKGAATGEKVRLTWKTASERGNAGFEVQRTVPDPAGAGTWETIGFVDSKSGSATTSETRSYEFTDANVPYEVDTPRYRLRQVDVDGSVSLTDTVTVDRPVERVELRKTFPNPARGQVTVRYAVPERRSITLQIYDVLGRQVLTTVRDETEGRKERQMDVSGLSTGTYFLRLGVGSKIYTQKFTIVR